MGKKRWIIILALFVANTLNYVDRVNMSVAGPAIAHEFQFGPATMGMIFSCFFYSYLILIIPMGLLADRYGSRLVSTSGMGIWSIGAILTGAMTSFPGLVAARLVLGAGEASSYPTGNRIVREWSPREERGIFTSLFNIGSTVGPAAGIMAAAAIIAAMHWRTSFYILGGITLVWTVIWWAIYRAPERASWLSEQERSYILTHREPIHAAPVQKMSLASLLRKGPMWGLLLTQGCQTYSIYLFLTWLPSYLQNVRGYKLFDAGLAGMLPYLVASVGALLVGALSDRMLKGRDLSTGRRKRLMIVMMLLASCVLFVPYVANPILLEVLLVAAIGFLSAANTLNFALAGDLILDKGSAGTAYGLLVLGGNLFGFTAPILTGYIIAVTHEYTLSFVLAGVLLLVGTCASGFLVNAPLQPRAAFSPTPRTA
jgi:ACS family glucarate transporter-like MFS transporter